MKRKASHITELFCRFAKAQQKRLAGLLPAKQGGVNSLFEQLVCRYKSESQAVAVRQAILDPYFPLGILERTVFADVDGMRFFVNKHRTDLDQILADELAAWALAFLRIRNDIVVFFSPQDITCIPLDGRRHQLPTDQWCTLCGRCCQIGGVPPNPPTGSYYPAHWYRYLSGGAVDNQQLCPFLFQYFGEMRFFCAIHNIKPVSCRKFDEEDCRQRLSRRDLYLHVCRHP